MLSKLFFLANNVKIHYVEVMINDLYQKAILRHAANATGHGELESPDISFTLHNPTCGDKITVHLSMDGCQINTIAHQTKACVLCQASASILTKVIESENADTIEVVFEELTTHLKEKTLADAKWPEEKWQELNIFAPVSDHKNRHKCVTLPFEAVVKAIEKMTTES